jgi:NAD(P)-dependent dehydrogenase (short-subunit alcohol dehydrogenase family)
MDPLAALTKIGHAFFARDGVRLAFGKRWDGQIIHISQASRGSACGCKCPAKNCGRKLVARKPDSDIAHHFAHAPLTREEQAAGNAPSCKHGNMTALHHYAEQLLNMGHRGAPGASLYTASKHAVEGLTKSAALEGAASGIRVNAIAPGPVETELLNRFTGTAERKAGLVAGVPLKRAGTPAEIADTIVFVASRKASFITGQIIDVNGGKTAS